MATGVGAAGDGCHRPRVVATGLGAAGLGGRQRVVGQWASRDGGGSFYAVGFVASGLRGWQRGWGQLSSGCGNGVGCRGPRGSGNGSLGRRASGGGDGVGCRGPRGGGNWRWATGLGGGSGVCAAGLAGRQLALEATYLGGVAAGVGCSGARVVATGLGAAGLGGRQRSVCSWPRGAATGVGGQIRTFTEIAAYFPKFSVGIWKFSGSFLKKM